MRMYMSLRSQAQGNRLSCPCLCLCQRLCQRLCPCQRLCARRDSRPPSPPHLPTRFAPRLPRTPGPRTRWKTWTRFWLTRPTCSSRQFRLSTDPAVDLASRVRPVWAVARAALRPRAPHVPAAHPARGAGRVVAIRWGQWEGAVQAAALVGTRRFRARHRVGTRRRAGRSTIPARRRWSGPPAELRAPHRPRAGGRSRPSIRISRGGKQRGSPASVLWT